MTAISLEVFIVYLRICGLRKFYIILLIRKLFCIQMAYNDVMIPAIGIRMFHHL